MGRRKSILYRCFSAGDCLEYIGVTYNLSARKSKHRKRWPWFATVERIDVQTFDWRYLAELAEATAIRCERPRRNTYGVVRPLPIEGWHLSLDAAHELTEAGLPFPGKLTFKGLPYSPAPRERKITSHETFRRWRRDGFPGVVADNELQPE